MRDLTDDVALMRPVIDALRASGCDPDRVLVRVGLPPGGLPAGRFPHSAQNLFWKAAADECGEEHVGLHLAEHLPAFHGLLLEYLFLSSDTFGAGLRHSLRYVRLLSDTLQAQLEVEGERAVLSLGESPAINRHFPEMLAGAVIRLFGALTEGEFKPLEVQLMNETGAPMERYRAVYGCPTILGMPRYALVFDAAVLDKPSRHAAPELLRMHESLARRQLAEVERLDLVRQVRELIGELLVDEVGLGVFQQPLLVIGSHDGGKPARGAHLGIQLAVGEKLKMERDHIFSFPPALRVAGVTVSCRLPGLPSRRSWPAGACPRYPRP